MENEHLLKFTYLAWTYDCHVRLLRRIVKTGATGMKISASQWSNLRHLQRFTLVTWIEPWRATAFGVVYLWKIDNDARKNKP